MKNIPFIELGKVRELWNSCLLLVLRSNYPRGLLP